MKNKYLLICLIFFMVFTATGCNIIKPGISTNIANKMRPITLKYWRVWDGPDDFREIIDKYKAYHPNITIEYTKLRYDEYEQKLIEALAADRGPDIFSIHNTWTREYYNKGVLAPVPPTVTMVFPQVQGSIKKEMAYVPRTYKTITPAQIDKDFVDAVYDDIVIRTKDNASGVFKDEIYGLPFFIDTLAMYYNKDLFNNSGISTPPEFWNREFQQDVKKLTKQNNKGEIIQSGVALGGSNNIERASDILSVLMMQNGTVMLEDGAVKFHQRPAAFQDRNYNPGLDALRFYTDFANPAKEVYSWNSTMENSLDLFIQNKLAIMFGYSYMLPMIRARAPKLNFTIAYLPQIEGNPQSVNFANYWVEVVSKKSEATEEAWDFLQFASQAENIKSYLEKTNLPTALRALIDEQKEKETVGVFVDQVLTAKSWYLGADANAAETVFKEMINKVNTSQDDINTIINASASKVQQTINYPQNY